MIITTAFIATISIVVLALILTRKKLRNFKSGSIFILLMLISLIAGLFLILFSSEEISTSLIRQSWPVIQATVVKTDITGERASNPKIQCEYEVDGKKYSYSTDLKTPGFGRKRTRRQTAEIIINDYSVGSKIQIKYNPEIPSEAIIRTGPYWSDYMKISLGVILSIVGLYGIFAPLIKRLN